MTTRFVLDTGALICAEKGKKRALDYVALVAGGHAELVTPIVCVIEWWRGRTDRRDLLMRSVIVQPLSIEAAKAAGVALAALGARTDSRLSIDAAVMAFAALEDVPVITSDIDDLSRFKPIFPAVRLLAI